MITAFQPGRQLNCCGEASIQFLLGMGFDGAIRGGEGHAGEHEPGRHLVLIEEGLILLVHGSTDQLAGARRTGASAAGHRQINVLIRCRIKDRLVIGAIDGAVQSLVGVDERDFVSGHGNRAGKEVQPGLVRCSACWIKVPQAQSPYGEALPPLGGRRRQGCWQRVWPEQG